MRALNTLPRHWAVLHSFREKHALAFVRGHEGFLVAADR